MVEGQGSGARRPPPSTGSPGAGTPGMGAPGGATGSPFFAAWGAFVVRHRLWVLAFSLLLTVLSGWLVATRITVDTSVESFAATDSPARAVLEEYRDTFGRDDLFVVMVEGDVFTLDYLTRLRALHADLVALDVEVSSLGQRRGKKRAPSGTAAPSTAASGSTAGPSPAAPSGDDGFGDDGFGDRAAAAPPGDDGFGAGDDGFGAGDDGFGDAQTDDWAGIAGGTVLEEVTSLINVRRTRATGDGIAVGRLLDPFPSFSGDADPALAALKAEVLADPFLVGQVVGKRGQHSVIAIRTAFMAEADSHKVNRAIAEVVEKHAAPGFAVMTTGLPAISDVLNDMMMTDLTRLLGLSVLVMILVLGVMFRHVSGVLAPLAIVGLSAINTFALMALLGMPVTMLSNILPAFLFCVGIGDSIHLLSVYRDLRRDGREAHAGLIEAIATTGVPIFFTSLTTMVGLLSFKFASLDAIQDMGVAGAFGVMLAFVHSLLLLPVLLTFTPKAMFGARPAPPAPVPGEGPRPLDRTDRFLAFCRDLSGVAGDDGYGPASARATRRRRNTLLVGLALVGLSVGAMTLLRVWHNPLSWVPDASPAKQAFNTLDREVGGTANVQLLVDGTLEKGMRDAALLSGLERLQAHIEAYADAEVGPIVGNAFSLLDVVKETHQALHGGSREQWRLPDTERGIADMLFLFSNAGPDSLRQLATIDLSRSQMTVRIRWLEATSYSGLVKHIDEGIARFIPAEARVQATGSVYTLVNTIRALIGDLLRSFGTAFAVITLIMIALLRSLKLGLIAMVPNLMPIVFIMGIMGALGIPIDMNNLLVASISIGIAVDDTIHMLHHFGDHLRRHGNVERAINHAMKHSGRAMVATSIVLMLGFFIYVGASMQNIQRFGLLIGLTAGMALLVDLIFSPALLRTFYRRVPAPGAAPSATNPGAKATPSITESTDESLVSAGA